MSTTVQHRYPYPQLDDIENLEHYRPGGFHPVSIGAEFSQGRYRVLHKLGFGGSSTVWLARDQNQQPERGNSGTLVTLKVLSAEASSKLVAEIPDLHVPKELQIISAGKDHPGKGHLQVIEDHFLEKGPNGSHLCLVYSLAGPSILSMTESPGRISGSRRLRGDLARKVSRQVGEALELMHSFGVVHGDLTSSNVLFRLCSEIPKWDDDEVYSVLGDPQQVVITCDRSLPGPSAHLNVVAPVDVSRLRASQFLEEDVVLIDFGQSFFIDRVPKDYTPGTPYHYLSPEAHFDSKVSPASDIWAFACVVFEIRAGFPLFEPFFSTPNTILEQIVGMLGRFPDPWWSSWDKRLKWFKESGEPLPEQVQAKAGILVPAEKTSIHQIISSIGEQDQPADVDKGPMIEQTGTRVEKEEVNLLTDLLGKMLKYHPEDRITMKQVMQQPWFQYQ